MAKQRSADPLLIEIERGLMPDQFVRYNEMSHFVRDLHRVEEKLAALATAGETKRAVPLYEAFLAGCYEKIESCDDSGGDLGMFWDFLFCGWIQARQAAGCPAADTVGQILKWKENDQYGFCYDIEKDVAKVLNPEGYEAFLAHYRKIVDAGLASFHGQTPAVISEYDNSIRLPAMSLKAIYQARGDIAAFAALCERMGFSPKDCERLAELAKAKRNWKQALAWIEKGLALEPTRVWHNESAFSLNYLKPEILSHLGRKQDALVQAWADFEKDPSDFGYETVMRFVPKAERPAWHERAMEVAKTGAIGPYVELCLISKDWTRLAARTHTAKHEALESVSHYCSEPAAEGLIKRDAAAAAKLYRAMGFRILNAKKSKYYSNALGNFEKARDLYRKAGLPAEWEALVHAVRSKHAQKYGFMPGFERIVSGKSMDGPSFSERMQARWRKQTGDEKA